MEDTLLSGMSLYQLPRLYTEKWHHKMIMNGESERNWRGRILYWSRWLFSQQRSVRINPACHVALGHTWVFDLWQRKQLFSSEAMISSDETTRSGRISVQTFPFHVVCSTVPSRNLCLCYDSNKSFKAVAVILHTCQYTLRISMYFPCCAHSLPLVQIRNQIPEYYHLLPQLPASQMLFQVSLQPSSNDVCGICKDLVG